MLQDSSTEGIAAMTPAQPRRRASDAEAEHTVPYADPMDALHAKIDRVLVVLEGRHDENGEHHPGLSHRVARLESAARVLFGIFLAAITAQLGVWFGAIGGKHP